MCVRKFSNLRPRAIGRCANSRSGVPHSKTFSSRSHIRTRSDWDNEAMRKFWALLLREVRGYFHSPIAYIVLVFFLLVTGADFYFQVSFMNQRPASYSILEAFFN